MFFLTDYPAGTAENLNTFTRRAEGSHYQGRLEPWLGALSGRAIEHIYGENRPSTCQDRGMRPSLTRDVKTDLKYYLSRAVVPLTQLE